ncbi:MAG: zinc-binding dehydrogenase, partial [Chloroflexota bacterium]|nr:zinc-binding dehydrogenase [Chloroflexota bacterium]
DTVVVCGTGNIGLCMIQIARTFEPRQVIAVDARDYRLDLARQLGADIGLNVTTEDVAAAVRNMTDGYGCDVFIEASGNPEAVRLGLEMLRKLGTFVEFSVFNEPTTVNWTIIGDTKELTIHGSHLGPHCYPKTIASLADGTINVEPLVAEAFPIASFAEAMDASLGGSVMKNLIVPGSA